MMTPSELEGMSLPIDARVKVISEAKQEDIAGTVTEKDKGVPLWKYFLIAALIFLIIEALLVRLLK